MIKLLPVERVENLSSQEFLTNYKNANKSVVIEKLTQNWPARRKWTIDYFKQIAGDKIVPLYDCVPSKDHKHQHASSITMPLRNYLERIEQGKTDLRLFFYNILSGAPELTKDFSYPDIGLSFFKKLPVLFVAAKGTKVQMHFDIDFADRILKEMTTIENNLYQTKSKSSQDPLNFPIKLNNKLGHLNSLTSMGNFKPTDQAVAFKNEIIKEIDKELADLYSIFNTDIKELNKTVRESNINLIQID